jgi:hypothetical protein
MNRYAPTVSSTIVPVNRQLLLTAGLTKSEADMFAARSYAALPAWLRRKLKAIAKPNTQDKPRKLRPAAGELAFYLNPERFPSQHAQPNVAKVATFREVLRNVGCTKNQVERFSQLKKHELPRWLQAKLKRRADRIAAVAVPVAA